MMWTTDDRPDFMLSVEAGATRRQTSRYDAGLTLTFSGMNGTQIVMDAGTVVDLCRDGVGLRTERSLIPGMVLALFIECPDSKEDICIPEARVEWVHANRLGLSIQTIPVKDRERLHRIVPLA